MKGRSKDGQDERAGHITIDGQPLQEYLEEEFGQEIETVRISVEVKLRRDVASNHQQRSPRRGTGSGRGRGNPGVKRARTLSPEEIKAENEVIAMTNADLIEGLQKLKQAIFAGDKSNILFEKARRIERELLRRQRFSL